MKGSRVFGFGQSRNIRRIVEAAKLFMKAVVIVLTTFISPFREDLNDFRAMVLQQ